MCVCVYIYIYTFIISSDSFPIQLITEYWVEFPELYSRSLWIIYFIHGSVYMLLPNSCGQCSSGWASSFLVPSAGEQIELFIKDVS